MTEPKRRKYLRWILQLFAAVAGVSILFLLVLACTVALLPTFFSTQWLKGLAEVELSGILQRDVRIQTALWTWAGGVLVEGVEVADDPDFSDAPLAAIRKIRIRTHIRSLFEDRLVLDFVVDGLSVHLVRGIDGTTNLEALLADLGAGGPAAGEEVEKGASSQPMALPLDVQARVHLRQMTLLAEDRSLPARLALTNGEVCLDIPSIVDRPLTLTVRSDLSLDGRELDPLLLNVGVTDLFGPGRVLTLNRMRAEAQGNFPGVRLNVSGNMAAGQTAVNGRVSVNLPDLFNVARPLLPGSLAGFRPEGGLSLTLDASRGAEKTAASPSTDRPRLSLDVSLSGRKLAFYGLPPDGKNVGPFDVSFRHLGTIDAEGGEVHVEKGAFRLLDGTDIAWNGDIRNAFGTDPILDFHLGPLKVNIREILHLATPFLPAGLEMDIGDDASDPPRLALASVDLSGSAGAGPLEIAVEDLDLTIPRFVLGPAGAVMSLDDALVALPTLRTRLTDGFPDSLSLSARIGIKGFRQGRGGVAVSGLDVPKITVNGEALRLAGNNVLGISGRLRLAADLAAGRCDLPGAGTLGQIAFSLAATAEAGAGGTVDLRMEKTDLKIADLRLRDPKLNTRLSFGAGGGIRLRGDDAASVSLDGVDCRLDLGDIASLRLNADGKPYERMRATADLNLDLTRFQKALPGLMGQTAVGGRTDIRAALDGRIPDPAEIAALSNPSGFDVRKRLGFFRDVSLSAELDGATVSMAPSGGKRLTVGPLQTAEPIAYALSTASGKGELTAALTVGGVRGVPAAMAGIARKLPAQLALTLRHDGVESLQLQQGLRIRAFPLDQELTVALGGLNRVLNAGLDGPPAHWLKLLGGSVEGRARLGPGLKGDDLLPGLIVGGELTTEIRAALETGKRVSAGLTFRSGGMSLAIKDGPSVAGLRTRLDLEKAYRLGFDTKQAPKTPDKIPLSAAVMGADPGTGLSSAPGGAGRFMDRLRRRYTAEHPLSFDRALAGAAPGRPPLAIENAVMDIGLKGGLPGSEFFQADLLGGTVMGVLGLAKDRDGFHLRTQIGFTGIDSRRMFPGGAFGVSRSDAEIGGELALRLPLTTGMRAFLSGLELTATLSPIGSRALERFLYALDPYESNESIVSQRRLLRRGTPRWIKIRIQNGALSLTGEVSVSGARVAIPPIDRLNLDRIGGLDRYEGSLSGMGPLVDLLKMLSAETLAVDEKGEVHFK